MPRLRMVSADSPGIARARAGRGFTYAHPDGSKVEDEETLTRIRELAIPPAWTDVWISRDAFGHLQAAGTDAAGRRQYRYHDRWRERRDAEKFDRMLEFAHRLPEMRARVAADLQRRDLPREKALATAVRLLDLGSFRVGSESYARQNGSYGVATIQRGHVRVSGDSLVFDYRAKSGRRRRLTLVDPELRPIVRLLKRRRHEHPELLAYRNGVGWRDVRSLDVNTYVKELSGNGFSAKDFRTWHGTVLAAVSLALGGPVPAGVTARRRRITAAVKDVAEFLGNTPAVARASYVDPRLFDRFDEGRTVAEALERAGLDLEAGSTDDAFRPGIRERIEAAVLDLLEDREPSAVAA
ncbi:MAG TPA: DNA topoisomerase IB [Actinomycetota bacterium]|nr:DNA topoisomerase IB [Actinomycetota bacterium]